MNFGPVTTEGGERRLNVLFTRARLRTEVFCSFDPGDIDCERARGDGPRILQRFLRYAQSGILDQPTVTGDDHDSFFEQDVATVVRSLGYQVDAQVGSAGFRIDLGVRDPVSPGRYLAAIECDGATYHHALWARERDRLRQDVLENLGWRFYRIWSTDWFYRRSAEIERLRTFLKNAESAAPSPSWTPPPRAPRPPDAAQPIVVPQSSARAYKVANFDIQHGGDPHEVSAQAMGVIVGKIIEIEGPIHIEELARRVSGLWGKDRTGSRIAQAVSNGLASLRRTNKAIRRDGDFCFTSLQEEDCPIRDRAAAPNSLQRAEMLPPLEIRTAAFRAIEENGGIGRDEIVVAVTRMLGFQRTGPDLRAKVEREIDAMLRSGRLAENQGRLRRTEDRGDSAALH
jgi:very-short-patch-repair endonuclease